MAQPAAKQRRRIVPEQIVSPGADDRRAQLEEAGTGSEPAGPILLQKQREQAEWAREHLGPDRKVFLDLTDVAANKEVDWRKLLKERGVQKPSKTAAQPADAAAAADDPLLLRGRTGRQENTWTRMLAKLEATYCVGAASEEESESDGWGDDSDSDAEEEGGEGGASKEEGEGGGDGNTTGGEGGGGGKKEGGKKKERGAGGDYDYFDDFIDDEEFLELLEHDKRKPKHTGFFISKGEIERTEEMLPGFEELAKAKKGGKRKAEEEAGATDGEGGAAAAKEGKVVGEKKKRKAGEGGEAGAASEGEKPAKKKKKIVAEPVAGAAAAAAAPASEAGAAPAAAAAAAPATLSVAQMARMAGQMAAAGVAPAAPAVAAAEAGEATQADGSQLSSPLRQQTQQASQAPTSAKKKGPYEMPAAVRGAIEDIRRVAEREEAPPLPPPGEKPKKRRVPKAVGDAIDAFSPLFLQQEAEWGRTATNRILEALDFLVPFIAKASLSQRLRNKEKPEKKSAAAAGAAGAAAGTTAAVAATPKTVSVEQLRQLIAAKVQPKPVTSDDDFEPVQPRASTSPPTQATQAGDASGAAPATSSAPAKPQAWKALNRAVRDQVYQYIKERVVEGKGPHPTLLQEVYQFFPPNSIAPDDLKEIWKAGRAKERRAEKAAADAAAAAAAAAGQPAPAAAGEASTQQGQQQAQQQQQQQQQQQGQQPGSQQQSQQEAQSEVAASPEALAFANMAVAAAQQKVGSPAQPQQQQQQQQGADAPLSPAAVAAALAQAGGASAGGSPVPSQQAGGMQPASPADTQPGSQAAGPAAAKAGTAEPAADTDDFKPAMSDEELVANVVALGGSEEDAWRALRDTKASKYGIALARTLMLAGHQAMRPGQALDYGRKMGLHQFSGNSAATGFSKMCGKAHFAHVGKSKYVLRCLPGVIEVPREKPGGVQEGGHGKKSGKAASKASSGEAAAEDGEEAEAEEAGGEGSGDEEMGDGTEEAEAEEAEGEADDAAE